MNTQMGPRKIALGILIVCVLALIVGLFNAARLQMDVAKADKSGEKGGVSSLLSKKDHIALVDLSGMIVMNTEEQGLFESESNAVIARKALDAAAEDDSVRGVLLRINSPGGTVGMSQELNAAVTRVSKKKPIVASLGDLAASGGYYTACAADKIVSNPGTLTASIGVIISTMNLSELLNNKLGVEAVTIKSGKFKDLLSPYRAPKPEELALIQDLVNDSYNDFFETVIAGRTRFMGDNAAEKKARIASIKAVADGRIVHGREALDVGLVDQIGDMEDAYTLVDRMAKERFHLKGKDRLPLLKEETSFSLLEFLGIAPLTGKVNVPSPNMYKDLMPMSMRYPNQPLWVME